MSVDGSKGARVTVMSMMRQWVVSTAQEELMGDEMSRTVRFGAGEWWAPVFVGVAVTLKMAREELLMRRCGPTALLWLLFGC